MKISRKTWLAILIAGFIGTVLLAFPVLRYVLWFEYFRVREHLLRVPFEADAWKSYERQFGSGLKSIIETNYWAYALPIRLRMVDDLMERKILQGKTRTEVIALLGESDEKHHFQEWDLVYYLGPGRYRNAIGDSEWLVIRFNSDGRVSEHRVIHD
ncbi:MAG: outer membrane protein assembly factor BamE [Verrucomicrobia bacterium]|nr:outer membrane protein assembly factor BamE [Verrucomicrobiota bacterium]